MTFGYGLHFTFAWCFIILRRLKLFRNSRLFIIKLKNNLIIFRLNILWALRHLIHNIMIQTFPQSHLILSYFLFDFLRCFALLLQFLSKIVTIGFFNFFNLKRCKFNFAIKLCSSFLWVEICQKFNQCFTVLKCSNVKTIFRFRMWTFLIIHKKVLCFLFFQSFQTQFISFCSAFYVLLMNNFDGRKFQSETEEV